VSTTEQTTGKETTMSTYHISEAGTVYDTIEAEDVGDALAEARERFDPASYDVSGGTIWVSIRATNTADRDDSDSATIAVDPREPKCLSRGVKHDWQTPHGIVGGLQENPGVHGHGGGVVITEVCMQCGCARRTDTWAQNPETGEQGLRSICYEPGRYEDEIAEESIRG
jgi:hypothetical protein